MTLQEHIDEIMDYFDFERVHKTMELFDWQWNRCDGVPEVADLRRWVRNHIKKVWDKAHEQQCDYCISSGGFEVAVRHHSEGLNVSVKFVLEEAESNPDPDGLYSLTSE